MSTNLKHTPLPWKVDPQFSADINGPDGKDVGMCCLPGRNNRPYEENSANAAHIVKCVNLHDRLVELSRGLMKALKETDPDFVEGGVFRKIMRECGHAEFVSDDEFSSDEQDDGDCPECHGSGILRDDELIAQCNCGALP